MQEATRPLLRQIESLQASYAASQQNFHVIELNLANRLSKTELERDELAREIRDFRNRVSEFERQTSSLKKDLESERKELVSIMAELNTEKQERKTYAENCYSLEKQLEIVQRDHQLGLSELKQLENVCLF